MPPQPNQSPPLRHLCRYRELYLTAGLLAAVFGASHLFTRWPVIPADLAVGVMIAGAGLGLWIWRRRRRRMVAASIARARTMLKDRINNQLQIVMAHLTPIDGPLESDRARLSEVTQAVYAVARILDELSPGSVSAWHQDDPSARD